MDTSNTHQYYHQYYLNMPLTLEWLQIHQNQGYDLTQPLDYSTPLGAICFHKNMSKLIFDWLIDSGYGPELIKPSNNYDYPLAKLFRKSALDIKFFESIIKYIVDYDLWTFISEKTFISETRGGNVSLNELFLNKSFTPPMLELLLKQRPNISLISRDMWDQYPFAMLLHDRKVNTIREFLSIIELYQNPVQLDIHFHNNRSLFYSANDIAKESQNVAELLVRVCPQTFLIIEPDNITLTLANCFYNSAWFKSHPEEINLIPERFRPQLFKFGSKTKPGFRSGSDLDLDLTVE